MKILISNTSDSPLYQQIKEQIIDAILKGELDIDKAAAQLLDDFRAGKLGRISLERPAVVKDK